MNKKIIIPLVIMVLCVAPSYAMDWNTFQGDIYHTGFQSEQADFVTNLWIFNFNSPILGSPAIDESNMYLASQNGLLKCIDLEKGSEIWSMELKNQTIASPVVGNELIYIGSSDTFYAINKNNHEILWSSKLGNIESTAFVNNDTVYVGSNDGHLYGLDNETGNISMDVKLDGELKSSPIVVNDTIYIGSTDCNIYAIDNNGNSKWNYTTADAIVSSPAYGDGKIAIGSNDGNLYVLNESNGSLIFKVDLNNKIQSSPTIDEYNNNIYVGSDEGNLTCLDLRDGTIKWSAYLGSPIKSTPAISEEKIAVGCNNGKGYIFNKYTGNEIFSYNPGTFLFNKEITSSPVIYGNSLFFSSQDGYLYSLNLEKNEIPSSIFLYITLAIIIAIIAIILVIIVKFKGKKRSN